MLFAGTGMMGAADAPTHLARRPTNSAVPPCVGDALFSRVGGRKTVALPKVFKGGSLYRVGKRKIPSPPEGF